MAGLVGPLNENLRSVEEAFGGTRIIARGNEFNIDGADAAAVARLVEELTVLLERGQLVDPGVVARTIDMLKTDEHPAEVLTSEVLRSARGRAVRPKSGGQKRYVDAIASHIVTFGIGPAGTGKSYLAVALAVQALQAKTVDRIIMTRPAVEAGERLGFLPGDLMAKIDPYLRPLYDALYDMLGTDGARRLLDNGTIEVAPLAYMRGRTLNRSFIILDEAQNATPEQLKMFLTRIGFGSKVVVNGDITQVDLPGGRSGLAELDGVLGDVDGIAFVRLSSGDVVRHRIVADIVAAYEVYEGSPGTRALGRFESRRRLTEEGHDGGPARAQDG
jgi:phosphate starvation-inducible PhoH-like protein